MTEEPRGGAERTRLKPWPIAVEIERLKAEIETRSELIADLHAQIQRLRAQPAATTAAGEGAEAAFKAWWAPLVQSGTHIPWTPKSVWTQGYEAATREAQTREVELRDAVRTLVDIAEGMHWYWVDREFTVDMSPHFAGQSMDELLKKAREALTLVEEPGE